MDRINLLINDFCQGEYDCDVPDQIWKEAFEVISKTHGDLEFAKNKVHTLWTVNGGHLRRKVKDDNLMTKVLSVALPGYDGEGLTLYRGECCFLYESGQIGFCWTPKIEVATKFAKGPNSIESGGVLLKAYAPSTAILAAPNKHSTEQMHEHEYICDPNLLESLELVTRYTKLFM